MSVRLPLPASGRARVLVGASLLMATAGTGAGAVLLPGDEPPDPAASSAAADPHDASPPVWLVTVDPAGLPEPGAPADAEVWEPAGAGGMLSVDQLAALDGRAVVRDSAGRLRVAPSDWRDHVTERDSVAGLPGVERVVPAGENAFLVSTSLTPDQLSGLPGVVAVAGPDSDGSGRARSVSAESQDSAH